MKKIIFTSIITIICHLTQAKEYIITDYGVQRDSTLISTAVIQSIIDKAHANGGGCIVVPRGVFLSGALFFKANTTLKILQGGVLKGSDNIEDYPLIPSRMEGKKLDYYAALINAYDVPNFSITGSGTINGNGLNFWKEFWKHREDMKKIGKSSTNLEVHRPRLLFIWRCNNVTIKGVNLLNSGFWTTHLYQSNSILIENCVIHSPYRPVAAPSTDGIDIDVCKNVTVRNCYISVNDDAVCIKGGKGPNARQLPENGMVENILVERCSFGDSHGVLTIGSESTLARNIILRNCSVNSNTPLLRIKMRPDTYQTFENIHVSNISGSCGNLIELRPWKQFFDLSGSSEKPYGIVKNITLSDIKLKCKTVGIIEGNPADSISGITLKNIQITAEDSILSTKYKGISIKNMTVNGKPFHLSTQKKD